MYPYVLGIHFKSQMLCRLPHPVIADFIPQGFGRVIHHKKTYNPVSRKFGGWWLNPYDVSPIYENDNRWGLINLKPEYYSLYRWSDLQRRHNEPVTGPNMTKMLLSNVTEQLDR